MKKLALTLMLLLAACAPHRAVPAEGAIVTGTPAQATEQCAAQPELAWCKDESK